MIKKNTLFFILLFSGSIGFAQHNGQVFVDSNQNQKKEQSDKGFPAIVISDGYDMVQTNTDGRFTLPKNSNARFIFLRIPAGYKSTANHYIKIDDKVQSYDFGLIQDETQRQDHLRFIQITDTETPLYGQWIDNIRNFSKQQGAALIMHTGDICYEPGMQFHARQVNSELMRVPTYYTVGNHDLVKGEYGEKLFEDLFGPVYYSFEAGPAHFVVTPMPSGDYAPSYTQDQVIAWLKKDLALKDKNKPLIFINHDLLGGKDFVLKGKTDSIDLKKYNLKGYLYGHWHNNYSFIRDNDVAVISTNAPNKGGIDNSVGQFMVIDIDNKGVRKVTPRYPNLNNHLELVYPNGANMMISKGSKIQVSANVYASEKEIVSVSARLLDDNGNSLALAPLIAKTDWNWRGEFDNKLKRKGTYGIMLQVDYADGKQLFKKSTFTNNIDNKNSSLQLFWSTNVGTNIWKTSPLVREKSLFIAGIDDAVGGKSNIQALDKQSGKIIWTVATKNSVKHKLAYASGLVIATDMGGTVYAINEKSGKLEWSKELSGGRLPGYVSAGVVKDNIYYTGAGHYLTALNTKDGNIIWQNRDWNGGESMPGELLVTKQHLITGANWYSLFAHEIKTGKLIWKNDTDGLRFRSGGASIDQDVLYVAGLDAIFKLDESTGGVIAKSTEKDDFKVMASPLILDDMVIMPTATNGLNAYDKDTLRKKWNFQTGEALIYTSAYSTPDQNKAVRTVEAAPRYIREKLIFGASDGFLYVLNKDGSLQDKINLGAPLLTEVSVDGEHIYVADFAGNIYCLRLNI